jgi:ABC-type oligopeptide transport system ATPase subunit
LTPFHVKQGQHLVITGRTGSGKSYLASSLLLERPYLLVLRSKKDDIHYPTDRRVTTLKTARQAMENTQLRRIEVEPEYDAQGDIFGEVLDRAYKQGGWTIYVDEGYRLEQLKLRPELEKHLTQGRSLGISMVVGIQRPAWVSRFTLSEASHALSFHCEGRDRKTLKESVGEGHEQAVAGLQKYQFAWTSVSDRGTWVGRVQDLQSPVREEEGESKDTTT